MRTADNYLWCWHFCEGGALPDLRNEYQQITYFYNRSVVGALPLVTFVNSLKRGWLRFLSMENPSGAHNGLDQDLIKTQGYTGKIFVETVR